MNDEIDRLERELAGLKAQLVQAEHNAIDLRLVLAAKKRQLDRLVNQVNNPHIINDRNEP
jgi:hypothetical protein